jgi:hypothetical protein
MAGGDAVFHIRVKAVPSAWEGDPDADAEIIALTPETALVRVNPTTAWDSDGLRRLSVALEVAAQALERAQENP